MTVEVIGAEGNFCDVDSGFIAQQTGAIRFTGKGGSISIGEGSYSGACNLTIGDGCEIAIGKHCNLGALTVHTAKGSRVSIGDYTGFTWGAYIYCHEPLDVSIGAHCIFAIGTTISVSDMHSIVDLTTGKRINPASSVTIGDRVWLCEDVMVMKGVKIGSGSILAARAVVTKDVGENTLAGGTPAKTIKENVSWDFNLI